MLFVTFQQVTGQLPVLSLERIWGYKRLKFYKNNRIYFISSLEIEYNSISITRSPIRYNASSPNNIINWKFPSSSFGARETPRTRRLSVRLLKLNTRECWQLFSHHDASHPSLSSRPNHRGSIKRYVSLSSFCGVFPSLSLSVIHVNRPTICSLVRCERRLCACF